MPVFCKHAFGRNGFGNPELQIRIPGRHGEVFDGSASSANTLRFCRLRLLNFSFEKGPPIVEKSGRDKTIQEMASEAAKCLYPDCGDASCCVSKFYVLKAVGESTYLNLRKNTNHPVGAPEPY